MSDKTIYFDMDGTIADLYGVEGWLKMLRAEDATPYAQAKPIVNTITLEIFIKLLRKKGWRFGVISWLSKNSSKSYEEATKRAKIEWLKRYCPSLLEEETHFISYGTPKHQVVSVPNGVLIDDDTTVGKAWNENGGRWINAEELEQLIGWVRP